MELKHYFLIFKRWTWLIILGTLLGAAGAYVASLYETPVYQSSTKLLVSRAPDERGSDFVYLSDQQLAQTYIQLLTTQPVLESVKNILGYPVGAHQISSQLVRDTLLIRVTVQDSNPSHAAEIANALIAVLIDQNEQIQSNRFAASEESLQAQLSQVENQIATLQQEIANVSAESLKTQQEQVKAQIDTLEEDILLVQQEIAAIDPNGTSGLASRAALSAEQLSLLQEKKLREEQLQSTLKFYRQIYLNLVGTGTLSGPKIDTTRLDQMQNTLVLYQQIYSNLLSSYESVRLARLRTTPNIVQVEKATASSVPIRPRPLNNAGLGGAVSLIIVSCVVLLLEYLDDTVKNPEDVTQYLGVSVIGYIPEINKEHSDKDEIYIAEEPRSHIAEAFRSLRTNLEFSGVEKQIKTLLVTSASPVEGKTMIAANLAAIMAQGGKKVLIVDADLRRPKVHRLFQIPNRIGLSDIFLHHRTIQAVTRSWNNSQLAVITSGSIPLNPAEILGSDKMIRLISNLKEVSDIVIFDSPPVLLADASLLASRVDGVLIVVQPGHSRMDTTKVMVEQLRRAGANIIGVVFNRIPDNRSDYYGGYSHYSRYYKYHGYYYGEKEQSTEFATTHYQPPVADKRNGNKPYRQAEPEAESNAAAAPQTPPQGSINMPPYVNLESTQPVEITHQEIEETQPIRLNLDEE